MDTNLVVPILGEAVSEAVLLRWNKAAGERVERGEEIAELETDKAVLSIECPARGVLAEIKVEVGTVVYPGDVLAVIARPGPSSVIANTPPVIASAAKQSPSQPETASVIASAPPVIASAAKQSPSQPETASPARSDTFPRRRISPAARNMARALGIDLDALSPARPGARITTVDVQRHAAAAAEERFDKLSAPASSKPGLSSPEPGEERFDTLSAPATGRPSLSRPEPGEMRFDTPGVPSHRIQLTRVQKLAAARMIASARDIPQFSVSVDAEAGRLLKARQELAGLGLKASLTAMLIYLTARALADHPLLNAQYDQDEVIIYEQVNLGVAVSAPGGLAVPVIHRAGERTLGETAAELESVAQAARDSRLSPDQVSGATFTLSNLGMYGVREFVPLVNPPQAAILGVGAARPAALPTPDWGLRAAQLITLTVSADHRVLDGEAVARFLDTLRQRIENPDFISTRS